MVPLSHAEQHARTEEFPLGPYGVNASGGRQTLECVLNGVFHSLGSGFGPDHTNVVGGDVLLDTRILYRVGIAVSLPWQSDHLFDQSHGRGKTALPKAWL